MMIGRMAVVAVLASGCATSTYERSTLKPGELHWRFDGDLQLHDASGLVATQTTWSGLPDRVRCVEAAGRLADSAHSRSVTAKSMFATGMVSLLVGMGLVAVNLFPNTEEEETGAAIGAGLVLVSFPLSIGAAALEGSSLTRALDAVNVYNEGYPSASGCQSWQ